MFKFFSNAGSLNLKGKFFIYFSGLVLLVVSIVSITVFYFQKQMLSRQASEKAITLTRTLAYVSLNAVLVDDYITLQMLIDAMSDGPDIISIVILDTTGTVIAANTPEKRGEQYKDELTRMTLLSNKPELHKDTAEKGQEIWDTAVPINNLNKRLGTARIRFSVEDTYAGLLRSILGIGFVAVLISLFIAYQMSAQISKPIQDAVKLADEYGKGNLEASLDINRDDEIGHLVESLNKLSNNLKALIDEKIANENLIMIGEFGSYIIHDLKNPLSGIHLLADGLHRKLPDDSPLKKYAYEILLASQKLEEFTKRTLDISRPSQLNMKPVNINQLLENTINEVHFMSISVIRKFDENIPDLKIDPQLMEMAVKNLFTNAIESISENGTITVQTKLNDKAEIKITDTGSGIPEDRIQNIFRPFFSMKNTGHGLGLAMVKKVITAHQGTISVQSEEGKGSSFTIYLPLS
jgi:signal transduction histidine kinase